MPKPVPPENPCKPGSKIIGGTYDWSTQRVRMHVLTPSGNEVVVQGQVTDRKRP